MRKEIRMVKNRKMRRAIYIYKYVWEGELSR